MFGINCLNTHLNKRSYKHEQGQRSRQRSNENESDNG